MKRKSKIILFSAAAAGVAFVCSAVLYRGPGPPAPDVSADSPRETVEYLSSEDFVKMDKADKQQYLDEVGRTYGETPMLTLLLNSGLSEQQRQKLMESVLPVIGPVMNRRIDEFESLSAKERTARLDAIIDRLEQYRRSNPGAMLSPERFNLMLQHVDPYTRARLRKHIPEMRRRMEQRGIPTGDRPF